MNFKRLGKSSRFNKLVCESTKAIDENNYDVAVKTINEALKLFPENKETRFYRITVQVASFQQSEDPDLEFRIIKNLNDFIKEKKNEHMLYYFRGIFRLHKQDFSKALKDFDKAINYCENIIPKYYLGRARCYGCISMFKEAIQDANIALEANDSLIEAYILRGKCSLISGDTNQAFVDFQKVIKLRPEDPMMHIHAGNILMVSGAYDQSIKAYSNAYKLGGVPMALFGRAKCYVALCSIPKALADVSNAAKEDKEKFEIDLGVLEVLNSLSKVFNLRIAQSTASEKMLKKEVKRLSDLIEKLNLKGRNNFEVNNMKLVENIDLDNSPIFSVEDLILYRGILKFYLKQYKEAIKVSYNEESRIWIVLTL